MKRLKAYKCRIYMTEEQKTFFGKTFGCVILDDRMRAYEETKNGFSKKRGSQEAPISSIKNR